MGKRLIRLLLVIMMVMTAVQPGLGEEAASEVIRDAETTMQLLTGIWGNVAFQLPGAYDRVHEEDYTGAWKDCWQLLGNCGEDGMEYQLHMADIGELIAYFRENYPDDPENMARVQALANFTMFIPKTYDAEVLDEEPLGGREGDNLWMELRFIYPDTPDMTYTAKMMLSGTQAVSIIMGECDHQRKVLDALRFVTDEERDAILAEKTQVTFRNLYGLGMDFPGKPLYYESEHSDLLSLVTADLGHIQVQSQPYSMLLDGVSDDELEEKLLQFAKSRAKAFYGVEELKEPVMTRPAAKMAQLDFGIAPTAFPGYGADMLCRLYMGEYGIWFAFVPDDETGRAFLKTMRLMDELTETEEEPPETEKAPEDANVQAEQPTEAVTEAPTETEKAPENEDVQAEQPTEAVTEAPAGTEATPENAEVQTEQPAEVVTAEPTEEASAEEGYVTLPAFRARLEQLMMEGAQGFVWKPGNFQWSDAIFTGGTCTRVLFPVDDRFGAALIRMDSSADDAAIREILMVQYSDDFIQATGDGTENGSRADWEAFVKICSMALNGSDEVQIEQLDPEGSDLKYERARLLPKGAIPEQKETILLPEDAYIEKIENSGVTAEVFEERMSQLTDFELTYMTVMDEQRVYTFGDNVVLTLQMTGEDADADIGMVIAMGLTEDSPPYVLHATMMAFAAMSGMTAEENVSAGYLLIESPMWDQLCDLWPLLCKGGVCAHLQENEISGNWVPMGFVAGTPAQ